MLIYELALTTIVPLQMWCLLALLCGLTIGYVYARKPSTSGNVVGLLTTAMRGAGLLPAPKMGPSNVTIEDDRALVPVTWLGVTKMLMVPIHVIADRYNVQATCIVPFSGHGHGVVGTDLPLIVQHKAGMTYVVGLPAAPAQLGCERVEVTLTITPDDGSRPTVLRFNGAEPIVLAKAPTSSLEACD